MADDKGKRGKPDRTRISTCEEYEVRYWCDKFDCSQVQLLEAVGRVGPMVKDVRAFLEH